MTRLVDKFDGWMVINVDILNDMRNRLDPQFRSLKVISQNTGITIPQLSAYFSGKRTPNLRNFKKLCLYLQVKSDTIFGIEEIDKF